MSDDQFDLSWDGALADDSPLATIQLSGKWRDLLLGLLDILRQPGMWADGTDFDSLEVQIGEIERRIMGEEGLIEYNRRGVDFWPAPTLDGSGDASQNLNYSSARALGWAVFNSPAAIGDKVFKVGVWIRAGYYKWNLLVAVGPTRGIVKLAITGEATTNITGIDLYAASAGDNGIKEGYIRFNDDGLYYFECEVTGKNVSSSAYSCVVQSFTIAWISE